MDRLVSVELLDEVLSGWVRCYDIQIHSEIKVYFVRTKIVDAGEWEVIIEGFCRLFSTRIA
jgi:hypothetical protein